MKSSSKAKPKPVRWTARDRKVRKARGLYPLTKVCKSCPFRTSSRNPMDSMQVIDIEYQIREHNGFVTCSEKPNKICAGSNSVALKTGIADKSAIYRFSNAELTKEEISELKKSRITHKGFLRMAEELERREESERSTD